MIREQDEGESEFRKKIQEDVWVWVALLVLLGLTFGVSYTNRGAWTTALGFAISAMKTALIACFYMHLSREKGMTRIFALSGIAWLIILFSLALSDFATRGWLPYPSRWPIFFQPRPGLNEARHPLEKQAPMPGE